MNETQNQEPENVPPLPSPAASPAESQTAPPTAEHPPPTVGNGQIALSSALGQLDSLTEMEQVEFVACERVIASGWQTFVQVGLALARIRDAELYRDDFDDFLTYCRIRWQYGKTYVYRLISAAQLFAHLSTNCGL